MDVHARARARPVCTWQFDRVSPQISTNTATNCSRLAIKNSRTHVLHVDAGSFVRITPNKSRSRDRRQGGTGGAERSTGAMETHSICMESDSDSIFYYILNRIQMQIRILSDMNTKRMFRIRIRIRILT